VEVIIRCGLGRVKVVAWKLTTKSMTVSCHAGCRCARRRAAPPRSTAALAGGRADEQAD